MFMADYIETNSVANTEQNHPQNEQMPANWQQMSA
jgi:hypothetical protein